MHLLYHNIITLSRGIVMSLCFLSKENSQSGYSMVDNRFITDFMPSCTSDQTKVYLYGLYLCNQNVSLENSIQNMQDCLSMSSQDIISAFEFLSSLGLVTIITNTPLSVRYEKIKDFNPNKKFKKEKYSDFNQQYLNIFPTTTQVNPNIFLLYYDFIEESRIDPEVMIMIIQYCVSKKGEKISPNYIITVAKDWVGEGIRTVGGVEEKIKQMEATTDSLMLISRQLGKTTVNTFEDRGLFLKWTNNWGFDLQSILCACKLSKKNTSMQKLDKVLDELYKVNRLTQADVEEYFKDKQNMLDNAYQINKKLGLWIENVEIYLEKYLSVWLSKGYDYDTIQLIADHCFDKKINSYDAMDKIVNNLYKAGCIDKQSVSNSIAMHNKLDDKIKFLIASTGSSRTPTNHDRDLLKLWSVTWGFDMKLIEYACTLSVGKPYAFGYAGNILSKWKANSIITLEQAKAFGVGETKNNKSNTVSEQFNNNDRKLSEEDFSSFFDDLSQLDNLEI